MTIKELAKHRSNLELIECIDRKLALKEARICVEGSAGPPSFEKKTRVINGYIHGLGTVSLLAEKSRLEKENREIEEYIASIPNRRVYNALYHYCLDDSLSNPTWDEVAVEMHEYSTKALKTYVERYLKYVL
ncbi:hypothetical protein [Ruminococcus sp. Marseille-P6503]|uniref:hypothetical protein n=1 Tax=Ruminococcus sp. Marseille-P6503 TaxID=2364796 RepID=UPI000F52BB01|nr:hypothetical protein [Ruminococcus sp. Marseille-P6503]